MHLTYAQMLAIAVHENMKLGDNTFNNVHKISENLLANCRLYFTASQQGHLYEEKLDAS